MPLLGGRLREVAYTNPPPPPTPPFKNLFYSNQGGGAWALVPLSYASDSGAARIFQQGPNRRCGRGESFENSWLYENVILLHINDIRGGLWSGIDQFPTLFSFFSFPFEFVTGKHFLFPFIFIFPFFLFFFSPLFPFSFPPFFPSFLKYFFFTHRSTGGYGPLVSPLSYASAIMWLLREGLMWLD